MKKTLILLIFIASAVCALAQKAETYKGRTYKSFKIGIRTQDLSDLSRSSFKEDQITTSIHTHPKAGLDPGRKGEYSSMNSDRANYIDYDTKYNEYVFMGTSGNIWQVKKVNNNTAESYNKGVLKPQQIGNLFIKR